MTARRTARWALHWAITCTAAAIATLAAALPFTGPAASLTGTVAATGVCLIGLAYAPHPGGTR
jgi:hypothetical protein